MNKKKIQLIFEKFQEQDPNPAINFFNKYSSYEFLIFIILSARTTDKHLNKIAKQLFNIANTPKKILLLGEEKLKKNIKSIGLFNKKSRNIIHTSHILLKYYCGNIPNNRNLLESLPGVGRKTANIILNSLFNTASIAVDTHVFRVSKRIGISKEKNVLQVEKDMIHNINKKFLINVHYWLIKHGKYICKSRKPNCTCCFISNLCEFKEKNI